MLERGDKVLDGPDGEVDFVGVVEEFLVEGVIGGFELFREIFC